VGVLVTETGKVLVAVAEPDCPLKVMLELPRARLAAALKVILAEPPESCRGKAASVGRVPKVMVVLPAVPDALTVTVTELFGTMCKGLGETARKKKPPEPLPVWFPPEEPPQDAMHALTARRKRMVMSLMEWILNKKGVRD
jgi:hypothetical protein